MAEELSMKSLLFNIGFIIVVFTCAVCFGSVSGKHRWNENSDFYLKIDTGQIIFHLCGSREALAKHHNQMFPDTPYDSQGKTYMFTGAGTKPPVHVWLVGYVHNGLWYADKYALGHELFRVLCWYAPNSVANPDNF